MQESRLKALKVALFQGSEEEHKRTMENLEELMRAIQERRSNVGREDKEDE